MMTIQLRTVKDFTERFSEKLDEYLITWTIRKTKAQGRKRKLEKWKTWKGEKTEKAVGIFISKPMTKPNVFGYPETRNMNVRYPLYQNWLTAIRFDDIRHPPGSDTVLHTTAPLCPHRTIKINGMIEVIRLDKFEFKILIFWRFTLLSHRFF